MVRDFSQGREASLVSFNRHNFPRAMQEQGAGESSRPRPDLDDRVPRKVACCARDLPGQIEIEEEILAKGFLGGKAVPLDDLTQGRQAVDAHAAARLASR
jgi:hypothetical protein